jgi:HTH-type transcriptional regulator / antitoxin HigA
MEQPTNDQEYRTMLTNIEVILAKTHQGGVAALTEHEVELVSKLGALIAAYEDSIPLLPFSAPRDLVQMIQYKLYELNITQRQMAQRLDMAESRLSEVLHRKKPVSIELAKKLYKELGISAEFILEHA